MTKILYVDMDNALVNFDAGEARLDVEFVRQYQGRLDEVPGIFSLLEPLPNAIDSLIALSHHFDTYIISSPPCENYAAATDKFQWVKKYLGDFGYKRLILTHHKHLNLGDYLIDNRIPNGVEQFIGEHIHFGSKRFPNWQSVLTYLEI